VAALGREMRRTRGETYGLGGLDEPIVPGLWEVFHPVLAPLLESEDDPALWERTLSSVLGDLVTFYGEPSKKQVMLADVGRCSRWLRPHQSRVMLGGGFASPFGYGNKGGGYSFHSLPEFDWYRTWRRDPQKQCWEPIAGHPGRRPLVLRIAVPSRSRRHDQAGVHTQWAPGTPRDPRTKATQLYFFRRIGGRWKRVADWIQEPEKQQPNTTL
jgi:hypothetical protein